MNRLRLAAALIAPVLALSACGGSEDSSPADPATSSDSTESDAGGDTAALTTEPATGEEFSDDAFTFNAPEGWETPPGDLAPQALVFAADVGDSDGFADNVNVVAENQLASIDDLDDRAAAAKAGLEGADAKEIKVGDPIELDGEPAVTITSLFNLNGNEYRTWQYAATRGEDGFVVTFSFSKDVSAADQQKIAESVAASWSWAS